MPPVVPQDIWEQVSEILRLIRLGQARTRPELSEATRLGRNVVTVRLQTAQELGLVEAVGQAKSRVGRAADVWEFTGSDGRVLIGVLGQASFRVALGDLNLGVIDSRRVSWTLTSDPQETCERMAEEMEALLVANGSPAVWGIGLGTLAPVDFSTGKSRDPVIGRTYGRWPVNFDIRGWFTDRMHAPVWVDSVSNLMARGALAEPDAPDSLVFVRMDRGVGSGIVVDGKLYRGADWLAGEITHMIVEADPDRVCQCGRVGCLDAYAGAWAIEAEARRLIAEGRSRHLEGVGADTVLVADVVAGAELGDVACVDVIRRAGDAAGRVLASVVTWFNPRRVVVGGSELASSRHFQEAMRRSLSIYALGASLEHLELLTGSPDRSEEVSGAFAMVADALLSPDFLAVWGPLGSPPQAPELLEMISQI